jgi:hypothetical protein
MVQVNWEGRAPHLVEGQIQEVQVGKGEHLNREVRESVGTQLELSARNDLYIYKQDPVGIPARFCDDHSPLNRTTAV